MIVETRQNLPVADISRDESNPVTRERDLRLSRNLRVVCLCSRAPEVGHLAGEPFDAIVGQGDVPGLRPDPDADPGHRLAGLADLVAGEGDATRSGPGRRCRRRRPGRCRRCGCARSGCGGRRTPWRSSRKRMPTLPLRTIVLSRTRLSVSRWPIEMPERADVLDRVLLGQAEPHAPAEEDADVVAHRRWLFAHDRPLRARAGVQAQAGVVVARGSSRRARRGRSAS